MKIDFVLPDIKENEHLHVDVIMERELYSAYNALFLTTDQVFYEFAKSNVMAIKTGDPPKEDEGKITKGGDKLDVVVDEEDNDTSTAVVWGIIGAFVFLICLGVIICLCIRRKNKNKLVNQTEEQRKLAQQGTPASDAKASVTVQMSGDIEADVSKTNLVQTKEFAA